MSDRLDIMTSLSGVKIETVADWENFRRPELMMLLEDFEYGARPYEKPDSLVFTQLRCETNWLDSNATMKIMDVAVNDFHFPFFLFVPEQVKKPVPAFLLILNEFRYSDVDFEVSIDYDCVPVRSIVSRGYALAVMPTQYVSPDWFHCGNFKKGVFRAMEPDVTRRTDRSWATLSAWAFGASRVLDYLETDVDVDHTKTIAVGHSRDGKTALWAAATDLRFAMAISSSSGTGGAAYTRGKKGEHIKDINISDWFCGNYHRYDDREDMFPIDQHMLLAAIAPRPQYIKSNDLDDWADPESELYAARLASKAYELYGLPGVIADETAEVGKGYHDGMIAYLRAPGGHNITASDWEYYMDFADLRIKGK